MKAVFAFLLVFIVCTGMGIFADDIIGKDPKGAFTIVGGMAGAAIGFISMMCIFEENDKSRRNKEEKKK